MGISQDQRQTNLENYANGKFQCFIVPLMLVKASGSLAPLYFPNASTYVIRNEN